MAATPTNLCKKRGNIQLVKQLGKSRFQLIVVQRLNDPTKLDRHYCYDGERGPVLYNSIASVKRDFDDSVGDLLQKISDKHVAKLKSKPTSKKGTSPPAAVKKSPRKRQSPKKSASPRKHTPKRKA